MVHLLRGILLMDKEIVQKQECMRRCFSTKLTKDLLKLKTKKEEQPIVVLLFLIFIFLYLF